MNPYSSRMWEEIASKIERHLENVESVVRKLAYFTDPAKSVSELTQVYEEIDTLEHSADTLKHDLIQEIGRGYLHPDDRESLLRFVVKSDEIANLSKASAKKILLFKSHNITIPESIYKTISQIVEKSVHATLLLREIFHGLNNDSPNKIVDKMRELEKMEKEVDELRLEAYRYMFSTCGTKIEPFCIFLPGLVDDLEEITDKCEEALEIIRSLIVLRM